MVDIQYNVRYNANKQIKIIEGPFRLMLGQIQ